MDRTQDMIDDAEVQRYREMLETLLHTPHPYPEERYQGRGIVICGGGAYYFPCVWVCIKMLREVGCTLPIELWHRGPHEMTAEMKALVRPLGVVCRDAYAVAQDFPVKRLDGWEIKPYALMQSRFADVLYIDADNMAVRDPTFLFETPLYQQTGALFWPEPPPINPLATWYLKREAWDVLDLPFRHEPEFEAGQLLIDKRRCWLPLQLTLHLNEHADFYYNFFYGDKDTFHLAWHKAAQAYSLIPHLPERLAIDLVFVHFDAEGNRLFQHRTNIKWTLETPNARIPGFLFEEQCFAFLDELQRSWSGWIRAAPADYSPAEREVFEEIVRTGSFRCRLAGEQTCIPLFRPDFTLDIDQAALGDGWGVEADKDGEVVLLITHKGRPTCFLRRTGDNTWQGRWRFGERSWVELLPENPMT